MNSKAFDYNIADSQGTFVNSVEPSKFAIPKFQEYEASLLEKNRTFWNQITGVAVHRRFRVPQVFSYGCKNKETSLALQLGALNESMKYRMDIPNFLEPWYGIGTIASSFGINYIWKDNQAPGTEPPFKTIREALSFDRTPIERTEIGNKTLEMIEFFLEKTEGKIPISLTDSQSPFNVASYLVEANNFYMGVFDNQNELMELLSIITDMLLNFTKKQMDLIGDALVLPGHGFSSSRAFGSIGMSDDNMIMISPCQYREIEIPYIERIGEAFDGAAFHSCGNWSKKIDAVKKIKNLKMVDGAFTEKTDPNPNPAEPFQSGFLDTGIILNTRMVGDEDIVLNTVKRLWKPGMKLIVVTYLKTPSKQKSIYRKIHEICN